MGDLCSSSTYNFYIMDIYSSNIHGIRALVIYLKQSAFFLRNFGLHLTLSSISLQNNIFLVAPTNFFFHIKWLFNQPISFTNRLLLSPTVMPKPATSQMMESIELRHFLGSLCNSGWILNRTSHKANVSAMCHPKSMPRTYIATSNNCTWKVDSGYSDHMTSDFQIFDTFKPCAGSNSHPVRNADESLS